MCTTNMPVEEAYRCVCERVFYCSNKCFERDPHSKLEDDEHEFANSVEFAPIEVNFSRIIGRGNYVTLMSDLANLIINIEESQDKGLSTDFTKEIEKLARLFAGEHKKNSDGMETSIKNFIMLCRPGLKQSDFDGVKENLIRMWKSDAPLAGKNIQAQFGVFVVKIIELYQMSNVQSKAALHASAIKLGYALNGKRS